MVPEVVQELIWEVWFAAWRASSSTAAQTSSSPTLHSSSVHAPSAEGYFLQSPSIFPLPFLSPLHLLTLCIQSSPPFTQQVALEPFPFLTAGSGFPAQETWELPRSSREATSSWFFLSTCYVLVLAPHIDPHTATQVASTDTPGYGE